MTRKNVPNRVRFEVLRRDGFRCRYCGTAGPESGEGLTVDHVVPVVLGGTNDPSNLVACCKACNSGKSSTSPDEAHVAQVADDALRWSAAMRRAATERAAQRASVDEAVAAVGAAWAGWTAGDNPVPRDDDWEMAVERFIAAGLPLEDVVRFVGIAMRSRAKASGTWAYFCGCCWNSIRELRDRAAELVAAPEEAQAEPEASMLVDGYNVLFSAGMSLYRAGVFSEEAMEVATGYLDAEEAQVDDGITGGILDGWRYERDYGRRRQT